MNFRGFQGHFRGLYSDSKGDFRVVSGVSEDFRNVLGALRGFQASFQGRFRVDPENTGSFRDAQRAS